MYKGIRKLPLVVHRLVILLICYNMEKEEVTRQKREEMGRSYENEQLYAKGYMAPNDFLCCRRIKIHKVVGG